MPFEPDKPVTVVARGESFMLLPFVLKDTPFQIAGYPDIERPAAAGHDVCVVAVLAHESHRTLKGQNGL